MIKSYISFAVKTAFLLTAFLIIQSSNAQAPTWQWAKNSQGTTYDNTYAMATDNDGNIYTTGVFESPSISFGPLSLTNEGFRDSFIVKYNSSGDVIWVKNIGGIDEEQIFAIAVDANNNIYITGDFASPTLTIDGIVLNNTDSDGNQDIFIAKISPEGNAIWAKSATGTLYDYGNAITVDTLGNVLLGGQFASPSITIDETTLYNSQDVQNHDLFFAKFDSSGTLLWAKTAGGNTYEAIDSMTSDANGNYYIAGIFYSPTITFGSTVLSNTNNYGDIFIVKYNAAGNLVWAKTCGGTDYENVRDIEVDHVGNVIITGSFESPQMTLDAVTLVNANASSNNNDIFIAKYSSAGTLLWAKRAGGFNSDTATALAIDSNNNCLITGAISSTTVTFGDLDPIVNSGGYDAFVAKYDSDGVALWAKNVVGADYELANNAAIDSNDNFYISGMAESPQVNFDDHSITMLSRSIFTAKMNVGTLSTNDYDKLKLVIYPNPVANLLYVSGSALFTESTFEIADTNGRLILSGTLPTELSAIDTSTLANGLYILKLQNQSMKFIKK